MTRWLPWLLLVLWASLQLAVASHVYAERRGPIDFLTYERAAAKIAGGESPYTSIADDRATWRAYHDLEDQLRDPSAPEPPTRPGPYLYPPTLALLIAEFDIGPVGFMTLIVASVIGFSGLWLTAARKSAPWLLLVVLSWDVFAGASGGNVEFVLLAAALAAAHLLWFGHPVFAAPFVAFVVLVKPFYALFFAAFVTFILLARRVTAVRPLSLAAAAALTLALVVFDVYRWGPALRAEAWQFMRDGIQHQWFVLPIAEQTPMSTWNRTPMQGLVNAGVAPSLAFPAALALWAAGTVVSGWRVAGRDIGFAHAFALAFVLLYLGRPVGWTLAYLEIVVIAAIWTEAGGPLRRALIATAAAVMLSHWLALALTVRRINLGLVTLQTAEVPWETWLLVPLCWLLLLSTLPARKHERAA